MLRILGQALGLIEYERGILLRHPEATEHHRMRGSRITATAILLKVKVT